MTWIILGLLLAAGAVAWRAFDDYRDRVKIVRKWRDLAEAERLCREQKDKQLEFRALPNETEGVVPITSAKRKLAA